MGVGKSGFVGGPPPPSPPSSSFPMHDDFTGSVIDTAKWGIEDQDGTITQNNQIIIDNPHTFSQDWFANALISVLSVDSGSSDAIVQAYVDWTDPGMREAFSGIGIHSDYDNFAHLGAGGNNNYHLTIFSEGVQVYGNYSSAGYPWIIRLKYNQASKQITTEYWRTTFWDSLFPVQVFNIGEISHAHITTRDDIGAFMNADQVYIDDFYFHDQDYSTQYPSA